MKIKYYILTLLLLFNCPLVFSQESDTLVSETIQSAKIDTLSSASDTNSIAKKNSKKKKEKKPITPYDHHLSVGFDLGKIILNIADNSVIAYEIQANYAIGSKRYAALESGYGKGKVKLDFLNYNTNSVFLRLGMDNSFLDKISIKDFDIAFAGVRYGIGFGQRGEASYTIQSTLGQPKEGKIASQNFIYHWGELVGGVKVETWKGIFLGWNLRAKFLLNSNAFNELKPNFIAGYGNSDKSTSFDLNFYISYGINWSNKKFKTTELK